MPPKKTKKDTLRFKYTRSGTVQVIQFHPQSVDLEDEIVSNVPITEEEKNELIKKVDRTFSGRWKKLMAIKKNGGVEPEEVEELEEFDELSASPSGSVLVHSPRNDKCIYVPKKCKDLSMKFSRGSFLVSVTSIFSYLEPIDFPKEALNIYAERGTLVHDTWEHCIKNKVSIKPSEFDPIFAKKILSKPAEFTFNEVEYSKTIDPDDCSPSGFLEKYSTDFEFEALEENVSNYEHGFYGRLDFRGKYLAKKCIGDVKTASSYGKDKLEKHWKQMAGYSLNYPGTECLVLVPLNPKNTKGFGKPIVTYEVEKYQKLFLEDLAKFKKEVEIIYV